MPCRVQFHAGPQRDVWVHAVPHSSKTACTALARLMLAGLHASGLCRFNWQPARGLMQSQRESCSCSRSGCGSCLPPVPAQGRWEPACATSNDLERRHCILGVGGASVPAGLGTAPHSAAATLALLPAQSAVHMPTPRTPAALIAAYLHTQRNAEMRGTARDERHGEWQRARVAGRRWGRGRREAGFLG